MEVRGLIACSVRFTCERKGQEFKYKWIPTVSSRESDGQKRTVKTVYVVIAVQSEVTLYNGR